MANIRNRPLYLWGAAQTGIGIVHALSRLGITPAGFIDKRKETLKGSVYGLPVFLPSEILPTFAKDNRFFIVDTTTLHADQIANDCRAAGLTHTEDFISYEQICPYDFQVIVSSVCNLRCISCPVGNRQSGMHSGFMSAADYEKVLDKILAESPLISMIQLFNWGEPMLNADLAKIVEITNSRFVMCSLSSNMNRIQGLESVIAAKPAFFRVSMSGNEKTYPVSHTGGSWRKLLDNLKVLSGLRKSVNPDMVVEVAYHVYANTTRQDIDAAKKLCESMDFVFRPHLAALLPLDNVLDYKNKTTISPEANTTISMVRLSIDEALARADAQKDRACSFERTLSIESDRSVKQCGLWTRPEQNEVARDFLTMPLDKIMEKRREHGLCKLCKAHGLHRFCSIYTDDASNLA